MKWEFGKSYKLFYFQVKESPAPLNIPTPTPAPDRGGPVARLGGPAVFVLATPTKIRRLFFLCICLVHLLGFYGSSLVQNC